MKKTTNPARPNFVNAWHAAGRIYSPNAPSAKVAQVIGGVVARNINNPDPRTRWENTCAVRTSYICYFDMPTDPKVHTTRASFWRLS